VRRQSEGSIVQMMAKTTKLHLGKDFYLVQAIFLLDKWAEKLEVERFCLSI
jgi:hypothetical protein